jgi:hypothetical protein
VTKKMNDRTNFARFMNICMSLEGLNTRRENAIGRSAVHRGFGLFSLRTNPRPKERSANPFGETSLDR